MNLIFDFDGTIADSIQASIDIVNKFLLKDKKDKITKEEVRQEGVKQLIKEKNVSRLKIPKLMVFGRNKISEKIPELNTFPGIPDAIKKLSKDHKLGIITSNTEKNAILFLKNKELLQYFDFVHSENDMFGKHHKLNKVIKAKKFNKSETFYIGDETRDIQAAKKAGVKAIAVTWGFESENILRSANPDAIIRDPKELLDVGMK